MSNKIQYENTRITGKLKEILEKELAAGNKIGEIYEGDWPQKGALMIFLSKPFKTPIQHNLPNIRYTLTNDPHYWKAEYADIINNIYLCCSFDGPNFDPL